MTDRNEQIEMLNAAKADVQKQLDTIFDEESDKLIASISYLSQVNPEKTAQFLAEATFAHFNSHDSALRSSLVECFSTAFGSMSEQMLTKGEAGWHEDDELYGPRSETHASGEVA